MAITASTQINTERLDAILRAARRFDNDCLRDEEVLRDLTGLRGPTVLRGGALEIDSALNAYSGSLIDLCATITEAAARRVSSDGARRLVDDELTDTEMRRLLRPIFDESGIGDRFEPTMKYFSRE